MFYDDYYCLSANLSNQYGYGRGLSSLISFIGEWEVGVIFRNEEILLSLQGKN